MRREVFSLRRLRWKLTLSYAMVTLGVLLGLQLVYAGVVAFSLSSDELPRRFAGELDEFAPRLAPGISRLPADPVGVRENVPYFGEKINQEQLRLFGRVEGRLLSVGSSFAFEGSMLVLDTERRVLDFSYLVQGRLEVPPGRYVPRPGERFDASRAPGLEPLVQRALDGERDPRRLSTRTQDGRTIAVAPILGEDGRVIGAVAGTLWLPGFLDLIRTLVVPVMLILAVPVALLGAIFGFLTARGLTRRIQRLKGASDAWSRGDFSATVKDRSGDELGQHARDLERMAAQLEGLVRTRQELAGAEARNRFAQDLHDSVKQQVFAASLQVETARLSGESGTKADIHLARANELLEEAHKELDVLIHTMRPPALEGKGLAGALTDHVADWSRRCEIPADVRVRGEEREMPMEIEQALFRVAQEALANVARHSGARNVEVDLTYEADEISLRVTDDGRGFDATQNSNGFGIGNIKERVAGVGGYVVVGSRPGEGTRVVCVCPFDGSPNGAGEGRPRG